jgi:hypothetical protein
MAEFPSAVSYDNDPDQRIRVDALQLAVFRNPEVGPDATTAKVISEAKKFEKYLRGPVGSVTAADDDE